MSRGGATIEEPGGDPDDRSLGAAAARGAAITFSAQLLRIGVQFASIFLLARLLTPDDVGIVVMVTAITGLADILREGGLGNAAVQAPQLTLAQRSNLFWINTGLGLATAGIVFGASWAIASFYDEPRLVPVAQALAIAFFLNGLSTQFGASLNRRMRFLALSLTEVLASALALVLAVVLALGGFGYWALVVQQIATAAFILIFSALAAGWLPRGIDRAASVRPMIRFGANMLLGYTVNYVSRNADNLVIGNQLGAAPLGLYNRSSQLLLLPLNQINAPATRVALPVLSRLTEDPRRYDRFLIRGQTVLLQVLVPIFALGIVLAQDIIPLVLGPQWTAAAPLFQILGIAGIARAAGFTQHWVALSRGIPQVSFHLSLISAPLTVASVLIGTQWGITGVAWAVAAASTLMWPIGILWYRHFAGIPAARLFLNGLRAAMSYGACAVAGLVSVHLASGLGSWARMGIGIGAFLLVFGVLLLAVPAFRRDVRTVLHARDLLRKPE